MKIYISFWKDCHLCLLSWFIFGNVLIILNLVFLFYNSLLAFLQTLVRIDISCNLFTVFLSVSQSSPEICASLAAVYNCCQPCFAHLSTWRIYLTLFWLFCLLIITVNRALANSACSDCIYVSCYFFTIAQTILLWFSLLLFHWIYFCQPR